MPIPTIRSGHGETTTAVTEPAAMIATFARASFRAERNAARVRLPLWARNRARRKAQNRLTPSAPNPVSASGNAAGGRGRLNLSHAVHAVAVPGAFLGQGAGDALDVGCGEGRVSRVLKECG